MFIQRSIVALICLVVVPGIGWAGKPSGGGGGADNVAPGPVTNLQVPVQSAARALTLKFTAPGDDGASGTATGYDVLYTLGPCPAELKVTPRSADLEATIAAPLWTVAPRSSQTLPRPGGTTDFFNVRSADGDGLQSGTGYCVAIRGFDEVGHTGSFAVVDANTQGVTTGADWPLARLGLPANIQAVKLQVAYPVVTSLASGGVLGWLLYDHTNQAAPFTSMEFAFEGGGDPYTVASGINIYIDSFRMVGVPGSGGSVGAVFTGVPSGSTTNQYMLVEAGPGGQPQSELIASGQSQTGGLERGPAGGITYVLHDAWNPVVALNRVATKTITKGKTYKVSQLELRERVGGIGNWASPTAPPTVVLTHSGTTSEDGYYDDVELFTKSDGTLGFLAPQCGIWVYAERRHSDPSDPNRWVWRYWDVGPTTPGTALGQQPRVTFNEFGNPVLARASGVNYYGESLQINHPDLSTGGSDTPPPEACSTATSVHPDAWETVGVTARLGSLSSVAEVGGDVYLTSDQELETSGPIEQRLIYRCHGDTQWNVVSIDRVDACCTSARAPLFAPDASIVKAYTWGYSGTGTTYRTLPQDYVFLAKQSTKYCRAP